MRREVREGGEDLELNIKPSNGDIEREIELGGKGQVDFTALLGCGPLPCLQVL